MILPEISSVHLLTGTNFALVWSKFRISCGGTKEPVSVVATSRIHPRNADFIFSKSLRIFRAAFVPFLRTKPILERNDLVQVFFTVISPPFCDRRDGSRCSSMPVVAATTIDLFTIPSASRSAWIYSW